MAQELVTKTSWEVKTTASTFYLTEEQMFELNETANKKDLFYVQPHFVIPITTVLSARKISEDSMVDIEEPENGGDN